MVQPHTQFVGRELSGRFIIMLLAATAATSCAAPAFAAPAQPGISWPEYVRAVWPVMAAVVGLMAAGALLALGTRFAGLAAFDKLKSRVLVLEGHSASHAAKIARLDELALSSPTRLELQEDISALAERMRGVEGGLGGVRDQLHTTNTYLQTLIERGLSK